MKPRHPNVNVKLLYLKSNNTSLKRNTLNCACYLNNDGTEYEIPIMIAHPRGSQNTQPRDHGSAILIMHFIRQ